ncbi:uncharacterized protein KD926_000146 [Aspergillus affinis]|uniref:uncharacterized protein n=1 Tax=Aspergillus affinis TaxID=1070780 RepID=UPI0022FEECB7|nr:uncharacterized protein KD926_000146 [Aspergillus affinis]KAI9037660.1 hypothetical protein KD926_000146 [Aspergillus affinis]
MNNEFGDDADNYVVVPFPETTARSKSELLRVIQELKAWLSPTDTTSPASEYRKHLNSHVAGTGEWILDTNQYRRWSDTNEIGDLWIRGIPGSGKSVVAASMVRRLQQRGDTPVLFFFFREIIEANRTPHSLLRDFCHTLLDHSPVLQSALEKLNGQNKYIASVPFSELWKCLVSALAAMPKVYCVIDALDEMEPGHDQFLQDVLNLGRKSPQSIKLILTSRQLPHLEKHLGGSCLVDLRLDRRNVDKDIAIYITQRLESEATLTEGEAAEIKEVICDRGKGLFLYARLVIDQLLLHPTTIVSQLSQLPDGLGSMYTTILRDHAARSQTTREFQRLVLEFVVYAVRPLRLLEIATMVDSLPDRGGLTEGQDAKHAIRSTCGPLLEVCEDGVIQIIHHSMTEFLLNRDVSHIQDGQDMREFPVLDPETAHANITRACIKYITRCCIECPEQYIEDPTNNLKALWQRFPTLRYASKEWPFHAFMVDEVEELIYLLDEFFNNHECFTWWIGVLNSRDIPTHSDLTPLHMAAHSGLSEFSEHLLINGADIECRDGYGRTPITYAAMTGHAATVQTLLNYKARYDWVDDDMMNAFHYAAKLNESEVVRLLLAAGADPLAAVQEKKEDESGCYRGRWGNFEKGETALSYACRGGHVETMVELQAYIDPSTQGREALHMAASSGQAQIVTLLLEDEKVRRGIDDLHHGDTALYLAAKSQSSATVEVLLKNGADIGIRSLDRPKKSHDSKAYQGEEKDNMGFTPVHGWAGLSEIKRPRLTGAHKKNREVLQLLINAGCDINATDYQGQTALFAWGAFSNHSCKKFAVEFISWLLENGADASIVDINGETLLHQLSDYPGEEDIVRILANAGADINAARRTDGMTPLHVAGKEGSLIDPRVFAELNGDFHTQDSGGNTPLHCILASSSLQKADQWIFLGHSDIRNHAGRTPLAEFVWHTTADEHESESILRMLIKHGANLESRDFVGRTALLTSLSAETRYDNRCIGGLLRLGADVKAVDFQGKSALHYASTVESVEHAKSLVNMLIDAGANINSVDHDGNSIFHETIAHRWSSASYFTQTLVQLNAPIHVRNYRGGTALHLAAAIPNDRSRGMVTRLEFLLDSKLGFHINAQDHELVTPLHIAATASDFNVLLLMKHGAYIGAKTIHGRTALHFAAEAGQTNAVGLLLQAYKRLSLPLDDVSVEGRTALHDAARSGRYESVKLLLDAGLRPNICDRQGKTPLHAVAEFDQVPQYNRRRNACQARLENTEDSSQGSIEKLETLGLVISDEEDSPSVREVVHLLLAAGADPIERDNDNNTPLDIALILGLSEVVDELAPTTSRVYASTESLRSLPLDPLGEALCTTTCEDFARLIDRMPASSGNDTVLKRVVSTGNVKLLEELLRSPKITLTESNKISALQLCARWGLLSMAKTLLTCIENLSDVLPSLVNSATKRTLCNIEMIRLLTQVVVRVPHDGNHVQDTESKKRLNSSDALHRLASGKYWWYARALTILLEAGADTELLRKGRTPLQAALAAGEPDASELGLWCDETFDILLRFGADVNASSADNERSPLQDALENKRDLSIVQILLGHGAELNNKPIVASAIRAGNHAALEMILKAGADPNVVYKMQMQSKRMRDKHETPLKEASAKNEMLMNILLAHGANPHQPLYDGTSSVLHEICSLNARVNPIIAAGFDLETRDAQGQTPLIRACNLRGYHNFELARDIYMAEVSAAIELIRGGVDLNSVDNSGSTALHYAICSGLTNVVEELLQHGARSAVRNKHGLTPLHCALIGEIDSSESDSDESRFRIPPLKIVRSLLAAGADPLDPLLNGVTVLHCIIPALMELSDEGRQERSSLGKENDRDRYFCNYAALYQTLIDAGCGREARDNKGNTPIFAYVSKVRYYSSDIEPRVSPDMDDMRRVFAEHDIFAVNDSGDTLLHAVASRGEDVEGLQDQDVMIFELLLELGLDPTAENKEGATALDVADAFDRDEILALFARDE